MPGPTWYSPLPKSRFCLSRMAQTAKATPSTAWMVAWAGSAGTAATQTAAR